MSRIVGVALLAVVTIIGAGCESGPTVITTPPLGNVQKLGQVEGSSCGCLGLLTTYLSFVPMGLNSRYQSAYQEALSKAPGATGLMDVTISEDWYWWVIGTARCVTVKGEAIK